MEKIFDLLEELNELDGGDLIHTHWEIAKLLATTIELFTTSDNQLINQIFETIVKDARNQIAKQRTSDDTTPSDH